MKISFVGYKESGVNIFPDLAKALSGRISGLSLEERFVAFPEDLPFVALECTKESDFVFVFAFVDNDELAEELKQKLVDVEIKSSTRILKAIEAGGISSAEEDEFLEEKEKLVQKYADLIVAVLFNENEFEPEEKDFTL